MAVVLTQQAAVFVDGRYTLQAAKQVDQSGASSRWPIRRPKLAGQASHAGDRQI
jgi:Xaa-Pro aminopeptidase